MDRTITLSCTGLNSDIYVNIYDKAEGRTIGDCDGAEASTDGLGFIQGNGTVSATDNKGNTSFCVVLFTTNDKYKDAKITASLGDITGTATFTEGSITTLFGDEVSITGYVAYLCDFTFAEDEEDCNYSFAVSNITCKFTITCELPSSEVLYINGSKISSSDTITINSNETKTLIIRGEYSGENWRKQYVSSISGCEYTVAQGLYTEYDEDDQDLITAVYQRLVLTLSNATDNISIVIGDKEYTSNVVIQYKSYNLITGEKETLYSETKEVSSITDTIIYVPNITGYDQPTVKEDSNFTYIGLSDEYDLAYFNTFMYEEQANGEYALELNVATDIDYIYVCYTIGKIDITTKVINGTYSGATEIEYNGTAEVVITPDEGYEVDNIYVYGATTKYTFSGDVLTIGLSYPTNYVTIQVKCIKKTYIDPSTTLQEISGAWSTDKIKDGLVRRLNLSSELDSITLVIENSTKLDINLYDIVAYSYNSEIEYWIVGQFTENISYNVGTEYFTYQIDLVSPTKLFELITLPCANHTNILGDNGITVGEYLKEKLTYYCASQMSPIFVRNKEYTQKLYFTLDLPYGLASMVCPEFSIGECTMRELIDYFMSMKNCTFKATLLYDDNLYFKITYLDYNTRGNTIKSEDMIITRSNTIENAATHLRSKLDNVINQKSITEYQVVKCEGVIISTDDYKLILNNPIYDIEHVYVTLQIKRRLVAVTESDNGGYILLQGTFLKYDREVDFNVTIDITDYVVIKTIYEALETSGSIHACDYSGNLKNNTMYYERGGNTIENMMYQVNNWIGTSSDPTIANAIYAAFHNTPIATVVVKIVDFDGNKQDTSDTFNSKVENLGWTDTLVYNIDDYDCTFMWLDVAQEWLRKELPYYSDDPSNYYFEIAYKTYVSNAMITEKTKYDSKRRKAVLFNNQTDTLVDTSKFTVQSIERVNQLGNDQLTFVGQTEDSSRVPQIGDIYDSDYTITNINLSCTNGIYEYKGFMTKNFVNTSLYTSFNKQKRYTSLASADEASVRHEIRTYYVEVNLDDTGTIPEFDYSKESHIAKCVIEYSNDKTLKLVMPVNTVYEGNLIKLTTCFQDNVVAGRRVGNSQEVISGTESIPMIDVKYTDDNGEFESISVYYYEDVDFDVSNTIDYNISQIQKLPKEINFLRSDPMGISEFDFKKDNREVIRLTTQLVFYNDDSTIIIGNNFSKLFDSKCAIYIRNKGFSYYDQILRTSSMTLVADYDYGLFSKNKYLRFLNDGEVFENVNLCVVDQESRLVLAVNNYSSEYIVFSDLIDKNAIVEID